MLVTGTVLDSTERFFSGGLDWSDFNMNFHSTVQDLELEEINKILKVHSSF